MMEMERLKAQEEKHYWEDVEMEMERLRGGDMVQEPAQEVAQVEVQDGVQNVAQRENQEKEIVQENGTEMENIGGRSRSRGGGTRGATRSRGSRSGPRRGTRSKKGAARGI